MTGSYRLAQDLIPAIDGMPRGLRAVVGSALLREVVDMLAALQEAVLHGGRGEALRRADVHLTRTRVLLRLAADQHAISTGIYEKACVRADEIGRMLGGWLRSKTARGERPTQASGASDSGSTGEARSS